MDTYILLKESVLNYDILSLIINYYIDVKYDEFQYGRCYQLVIDKSRNITFRNTSVSKGGVLIASDQNITGNYKINPRRKNVDKYIKERTRAEIIKEALLISITKANQKNISRKPRKIFNEWHKLDIQYSFENNFYLGRCVQFILDSNNKIYLDNIQKESGEIIADAHQMKAKMLRNTINNSYVCDCDICGIWYFDENRCQCGNRRVLLIGNDIVESLDDVQLECYTVCY